MTPIAAIEAIATILWVYAGAGLLEWLLRAARAERRQHIPMVTELLANLVPVMIALIVVVMAGAVIGLPSVVVIIALLFPAGLAFGLHLSLNDMRDANWRFETVKLLVVLAVAGVTIWRRQFS